MNGITHFKNKISIANLMKNRSMGSFKFFSRTIFHPRPFLIEEKMLETFKAHSSGTNFTTLRSLLSILAKI
jgi:hypothetical protein